MTEQLPAPDRARFPPLQESDVRLVTAGTLVGRIYSVGGDHPTSWFTFRHWGPTGARFDPHPSQPTPHNPEPAKLHPRHAVMYGAAAVPSPTGQIYPVLKTCLAEVYRDRGVVELRRDDPHFALMRFTRELRLVDLGDSDWVTRAGGNAAISSGERACSREWAREIHAKYADELDGLIYPSSNIPPARVVALWLPAEQAVETHPDLNEALTHPVLRPAVEKFAYELGLAVID